MDSNELPVEAKATIMNDGRINMLFRAELYDKRFAQVSFIFSYERVDIEAWNPLDGTHVYIDTSQTREYFGG